MRLGEVPADWAIPVVPNPAVIRQPWDLVNNVGHVVPHEVLGFANGNKDYFIGLAGKETICAAHMAAACCGIENNLGMLTPPGPGVFRQGRRRHFAHAAAHLIHGLSEGRFSVSYAPGHMSREEIEGVGFHYVDLAETLAKYPIEQLSEGYNELPDGQRVFFIPTPSAGCGRRGRDSSGGLGRRRGRRVARQGAKAQR